MNNLKAQIQSALNQFANGILSENAIALFKEIGYSSNKKIDFTKAEFERQFAEHPTANAQKALIGDWLSADYLFQLTEEEISRQKSLFSVNQYNPNEFQSYSFVAIELKNEHYARGHLSQITREVNKLFPMPVMILFKHGNTLSLSIIDRRPNERDISKDVLKKVTLIKDIRIPTAGGVKVPLKKGGEGVVTHRAHIEILFDLSFDELKNKHGFTNFVELHDAWQKTLDTKELNKKFYEKLFYWYLWAVKKVKFPQIRPKEDLIPDEAHQSESVIRLLTRLLFCWFMKEKQELIPELLFDKKEVAKILNDFSPENEKSSVFYRAILQNLFFATLSVPIKSRKYIRESFQGRNKDYGNQYVYRYQSEFADAKENLKLFKDIPFLNGGLFECLDEVPENSDEMEIRLDGFSSKQEKQAFVPDHLFWDEHNGIDLSEELDNPRKKNETVYGIIGILNSYKFTIEENTPLEEEIALDPELLGKVFESLLAYYNPETKANARKQTGSFYTPREIVNYMVDESLIAALQQKLSNAGITENVELRLRNLISYNETENQFTEKETNVIIQALENLKVLDPACGSGAFPMGILHKLVWILRKVDPENKIWFESIIKRLPTYAQPEMRKKLEGENWDFLRKLGVVQQSIYGVDIQPIAIQIAKLRFFISLLVDQDIKGNEQNNFGLFPLPNLDFKLVSANTLIGVPENYGRLPFAQDEFFDTFNKLTGQYFGTYEPTEKKNLTKKIKNLVSGKVQEKVDEIQRLSTHADERFSKHLAEKNKAIIDQKKNDAKLWESYSNLFKHESVGFFEIKYFFPEVKEGFNIVIGNPPYLESRHPSFSEELKNIYQLELKKRWHHLASYITKGADLLIYFFESSLSFININGVVVFITQNSWLNSDYGKKFQTFLMKSTNVKAIIDSDYKYFDSKEGPNINTVISIFKGNKAYSNNKIIFARYHENFQKIPFSYSESDKLSEYNFAESKEYKYSDENLTTTKWGILLHSEDFVLNLIQLLKRKAFYIDKIAGSNMEIGQGLNLSKEFIVTQEFVTNNSFGHAAIPFVNSDDGAPFVLNGTANCIIDKGRLTKDENKFLSSKKIKAFDPSSTDKTKPILFMPRGIGRHFCAMNVIRAFTASCVDIYDYNKNTPEEVKLNLWLFLNSSILWLLREISGRKNLGGGMLKAEATDLKSFPLYIHFNKQNEIGEIYEALSKRQALDTVEELYSSEHKHIDRLVFDYLGVAEDIKSKTISYLKKTINERHTKSKT